MFILGCFLGRRGLGVKADDSFSVLRFPPLYTHTIAGGWIVPLAGIAHSIPWATIIDRSLSLSLFHPALQWQGCNVKKKNTPLAEAPSLAAILVWGTKRKHTHTHTHTQREREGESHSLDEGSCRLRLTKSTGSPCSNQAPRSETLQSISRLLLLLISLPG
ncbi:hypothetical protein chiPu_0003424 [Chiloscyllium punctatum]|uniref:Uncharacterized protein n=1 Tax=Chiloscyllium punctatum TaxID=137246 RepID=A0A401S3N9_CHIPU|nr:hypothetical protein [Chiloscyllium punctatum]